MIEPEFRPSRRAFLGGVLALMTTPVIAKALVFEPPIALPIIRGDGVFDDWAGLQALLRGEPFEVQAEGFMAIEGLLSRGMFRVSKPIELTSRSFVISSCTFVRRLSDEGLFYENRSLFKLHDAGIDVTDTQIAVLGSHDDVLASQFTIDRWVKGGPNA